MHTLSQMAWFLLTRTAIHSARLRLTVCDARPKRNTRQWTAVGADNRDPGTARQTGVQTGMEACASSCNYCSLALACRRIRRPDRTAFVSPEGVPSAEENHRKKSRSARNK